VDFTSLAYEQTSGILLTERLAAVWEIRAWMSKKEKRTEAKHKGLPTYVVRLQQDATRIYDMHEDNTYM